jgi:hypothetical protein
MKVMLAGVNLILPARRSGCNPGRPRGSAQRIQKSYHSNAATFLRRAAPFGGTLWRKWSYVCSIRATPPTRPDRIYDAGISGVIERMFSGFLPDEAEVRRYAKEVAGGRSLVVVGELDDSAADHVAGILARRVTGPHSPCAPPQGSVPDGQTQSDVNRVESSIDLDAMLSGPRVYPLLNSPTGWREASRGAMNSIGGRETDPGRPTGLLDDAGGLDTEDDRSRLSRSSDGTPTR